MGRVSQINLTKLLRILHLYHKDLPIDARTLLRTPSNLNVRLLGSGEFLYFRIQTSLKRLISKLQHSCQTLELSFNVDGLPLFHSNNLQIWPILGKLGNVQHQPFVVAIFCGTSKPVPVNDYLRDLIKELVFNSKWV